MRFSYKRAIAELTTYALSEGYQKVTFDHIGVSNISWAKSGLNKPQYIKIEGKHTLEIQTYIFLHELGHHELRKDWESFTKRFPTTAHAEHKMAVKKERKYSRRDSYVVASLEEEFMAWDEGLKLAERMGIRINVEKWVELKSKNLKAYIGYYANLKK